MKIEEPTQFESEKRLFDRITIDGWIRSDGSDYRIRDLSTGGLSLAAAVPGWNEGDVRRVQFAIRHGALLVCGDIQCQCLENSETGITRCKFVEPSEDITEFFRAVTLRSVSGSEYNAGWLPETSTELSVTKAAPQQSWSSYVLSLPMLVLAMFLLLLSVFVSRNADGNAYWVTQTHEITSPVSGRIGSLETGPFNVGDPISEIFAISLNGDEVPATVAANVASFSVDWRYSAGDQITPDDILGYLRSVPQNNERFSALVSLRVPFFSLDLGDQVVIETGSDQRVVGQVQRFLTVGEARTYANNDYQFPPNSTYALLDVGEATVDFSASLDVRVLDTVLENAFR